MGDPAVAGARFPGVDEDRFAEFRQAHEEILSAFARLEAGLTRNGSADADGGRGALVAAVAEFLAFYDATLAPHMRAEEDEIYPLLDRFLPPDVGSGEALRQEHETARSLVALLRRLGERLRAGAPDIAGEIASVAQDLAALLRDHIRKEDHVVNPLLLRLLREGRRA